MCISFLQAKHPVAVWSGCHVLVEPGHVNTHPVYQHVELVAVGRFVATQKSYFGWLERLLNVLGVVHVELSAPVLLAFGALVSAFGSVIVIIARIRIRRAAVITPTRSLLWSPTA